MVEYMLLIGSIGATATYQAGFAPPRSFWPDDSSGHAVGNPVLRDTNAYLYRIYFFCNTTAFMASSFVMNSGPTMNLLRSNLEVIKEKQILYSVLQAPTVLFAIGIVGAYAAGSTSGWNNNFIYAAALLAPVLSIIIFIDSVVKLAGIMAEFMKKVSEE